MYISFPFLCFSVNETGEIVRDCMVDSSLLIPGEYETCTGDKCNFFNFPRDRLLCQQCENCDQIQREPELCRIYFKYHMACISYIAKDTNQIKRGCQSDPDDTFCDDGNTHCVYCMYDDCNRDPRERRVAQSCYFCNTSDPDCYAVQDHTEKKKFYMSIRMGEVYYCWTIFAGPNNGLVLRFHEFHPEFEPHFRQFCGQKRLPSPQCPRCFGNLCNNHFRNGRCYECLEEDRECDAAGLLLTPVQCERNYLENFGCYGLLQGEQVGASIRRGCITDLDYLHQKSCSESQSCFFCRGDFCNQRSNLCYSCSGPMDTSRGSLTRNDNVTIPSCLNTTKEQWGVELCGAGDSCYLHIAMDNAETLIQRGCMSGSGFTSQELFDPGAFQLCHSHLCNDWPVLSDSFSCYDLQGAVLPCANKTNHCYTVYYLTARGSALFQKGCYNPLQKFNVDQMLCDKHIETCKICAGELCNGEAIIVNMTRRCMVCNDRKSCMYYDGGRGVVNCTGTRLFFESESCFYGLDSVSRNITRGCTMLAFPGRKTPTKDLLYCPTDGCNAGSVNDFQCYQCDSNSPSTAPGYCFVVTGARKEVVLKPSACVGSSIFQMNERGCYTYYTPTKIFKRGCIRHLNAETIAYCEKNQTHCRLCYQEECNNMNINRGLHVQGLPGMKLVLICIWILRL